MGDEILIRGQAEDCREFCEINISSRINLRKSKSKIIFARSFPNGKRLNKY